MFSANTLAAIAVALLGVAVMLMLGAWLAKRWPSLTLMRRWIVLGVLGVAEIAFWVGLYGYFIAPNRTVVREVSIASDRWRGPPLRVVALADLDIGGPHVAAGRVEDLVGRVNELRPDLVVLLGNIVGGKLESERTDADREQLTRAYTALALFNAKYGVLAVLGPDDLRYGRQAVSRSLENAGIGVLWNRSVEISGSGNRFAVAGLAPDSPDLSAIPDDAVSPVDTLVLTHDLTDMRALPQGVIALSVCARACGRSSGPGRVAYASPSIGGRIFRLSAATIEVVTVRSATNEPYPPLSLP